MLTFPGIKADEPITQAAAKEIKATIGDYLGATLVESVDPLWPGDPSIEKMKPSYTDALAQLVPVFFPDILYRLTADGQPQFPEFAAKIKPTEFAPGKTFGSGTMKPIDYMVELAEGRVPIPKNLNIRAIEEVVESNAFTFHFNQYAMRRAADWKARGFVETLTDFAKLNARSKFWGDDQRAAFKDWEEMDDMRQTLGQRQGIDEHIMMRELLRRVEMKVLYENHLDAVVRLHYSLPPGKIGLAPQPRPPDDIRGELRMGPFAGVTEVLIPAGYVRTAYDPVFVLFEVDDGPEHKPCAIRQFQRRTIDDCRIVAAFARQHGLGSAVFLCPLCHSRPLPQARLAGRHVKTSRYTFQSAPKPYAGRHGEDNFAALF